MFLRFFDRRIWESLEDIRNVLIRVPRQSGKSTHARQIARDAIALDAATLKAASRDPVGFVHGFTGRLSTRFGARQKRS